MKDLYKAEAELARIEQSLERHDAKVKSTLAVYEMQTKDMLKAKAEAEQKLAQAQEKKAEIINRLTRQISEQSTEELVRHLVAQGITCVGRVDARDILNDAREMFERSFWTSGTEVAWNRTDFASKEDAEEWANEQVDEGELEKFIVMETPSSPGYYGVFSSLCAVGGIGVIASMRKQEVGLQEHTEAFGTMFDTDWSTRVATVALGETIRTFKVFSLEDASDGAHQNECDTQRQVQDVIISYNDNLATKDDVIERFREAASHPILDATELWAVMNSTSGTTTNQQFASKEAALEVIELAKGEHNEVPEAALLMAWCRTYGYEPDQLEPTLVTSLDLYERAEIERRKYALGAHAF